MENPCHHKTNSFYLLSLFNHYFFQTKQFYSYTPGCSGMFSSQSGMDQLLFFRPLVLPYLMNTKEPVTYNTSLLSTTLKPMIILNSLIRWWKKKKIWTGKNNGLTNLWCALSRQCSWQYQSHTNKVYHDIQY